jgi:hypothetical protein
MQREFRPATGKRYRSVERLIVEADSHDSGLLVVCDDSIVVLPPHFVAALEEA